MLVSYLLKPLISLFQRPSLMEISVPADKTLAFEYLFKGYDEKFEIHEHLDIGYWRRLCKVLANTNGVPFDPVNHSIVSVALPQKHRFQAKMGHGVESGIDISIRIFQNKPVPLEAFGLTPHEIKQLHSYVERGMNCLVSGGTSSGKTTFLRSLLQYIPSQQRILTLEDTREVYLPEHGHVVHHVVPRNGDADAQSQAYRKEIDHLMRSRPDVIVLGEVSTTNAFPVLRFMNTGHAGFYSTVHANTAKLALTSAIPQNITLSGHSSESSSGAISEALHDKLDMVIQLNKTPKGRRVTEIYLPKTKTYLKKETHH